MPVQNLEQKFEQLINSCDHGDLLGMVGTFMDEDQISKVLQQELSDEDKESIIYSHKQNQ